MNSLLSVIVPVFNSEIYLSECISSILRQTYTNLELLLIDDGSTDNSGNICDSFAYSDPRVRVFHIQNGGVSHARNIGILNAKGKYLAFSDNDDYLDPHMYEDLIKLLEEKKVDIVISSFMWCDENLNVIQNSLIPSSKPGYLSFRKIVTEFLRTNSWLNVGANSYWNKVYNWESIKQKVNGKDILADEDVFPGEDTIWMFKLYSSFNGIAYYTDKSYYYWRHHLHHHEEWTNYVHDLNAVEADRRTIVMAEQLLYVDKSLLRKAEKRIATKYWGICWDYRNYLNNPENKKTLKKCWAYYKKYGPREIKDFQEIIKHPIKYILLAFKNMLY